jgi:hypothetical protein
MAGSGFGSGVIVTYKNKLATLARDIRLTLGKVSQGRQSVCESWIVVKSLGSWTFGLPLTDLAGPMLQVLWVCRYSSQDLLGETHSECVMSIHPRISITCAVGRVEDTMRSMGIRRIVRR